MAFRIFIACLVLTGAYVGFEIYRYKSFYAKVEAAPSYQIKGPKNADVTIVEFLDYSCPHCQIIHHIVNEALEQRDNVRYIARPIPALGESSDYAIRLALAAGQQNAFWAMHEELLSYPRGYLSENDVHRAALRAKLNYDTLKAAAQSRAVTEDFNRNMAAAGAIDLQSTPTFLINNEIYIPDTKMPTVKEFLQLIDEAAQ